MEYNILWTSGWDSTYRVLDLVLNKKRKIQPYYVMDTDRVSTDFEIEAMEKIKQMIEVKDPEAKDRIKPTININIKDIPPNEEITRNYRILADMSHLGGQYDWLARFADSEDIKGLELSVHIDDTVYGFVKDDIVKKDDGIDVFYTLKDNPSIESLKIFSRYNFPLLQLTKLEMEQNSMKFGFADIMEETWFCHSPINNKPCGFCNPCIYTREEGMGRRVPKPTLKNKAIQFASKVRRKVLR
ncbi:hypothetical protein J2Z83_001286 [Virgibacillus natechei]|uniref:7-cyano-7-deazaguanine synthase n=1 Tax=Virgibacillus natechei TaxID=1216297 RepID=A0ABS4IE13_9BACI|nr:7-cyano-7-deazaguanine synthase [Virgibacillus natechei]MBP1969182.1 hypothetical protein [Virgibacillus natechei]UZD12353.1 7-cyano-7-deazaguanine synthase [Virgibacillus natechei]